jgi:hypothetical protein
MHVDKLTDEERRARALSIDQINEKIKAEYGDALAVLGCMPVIQRVWGYTVADHVTHALSRGIELNPQAQEIQRDWIDTLRSATTRELGFVVRVLAGILEVHDIGMHHRDVLSELTTVLSHAETTLKWREKNGKADGPTP